MILFRCSCGAAHQAEDQYAGGSMPCPQCGENVSIPTESDPAVALVYKSGESEDGIPMTLDDIRVQLVAGELSQNDLIWDNETWRPVGEVVGKEQSDLKQELRLKRPDDDQEAEGEAELANSLDDLSPIQHVELTPEEAEQVDQGGTAKGRKAKAKEAKKSKEEKKREKAAKKAAAKEKKKKRGKVYHTVQAVMGILAVLLGFKFGFGPLISSFRGLPTFVIVQNHEPVQYVARLGWRRLKQEIYQNSFCKFEIFVGMPERQGLVVEPKSPGKGEKYTLRVPVRPGGSVLVNLGGKGTYGVYEPWVVRSEKVASAELKALAGEISRNREPSSALKVSRQIRDLVQPAFKGTRQDVVFSGSRFQFPGHFLTSANQQKKPAKDEKPKEKKRLPVVISPAQYRLQFGNGYGLHDAANEAHVERGITLPVKVLNLNRARILKTTNPTLEFRGDGKTLRLTIRLPSRTKVQTEGKTFTGTWEYSASCPLVGAKRDQWTWRWVFRGDVSIKGKRFHLDLTINASGKETRKVRTVK